MILWYFLGQFLMPVGELLPEILQLVLLSNSVVCRTLSIARLTDVAYQIFNVACNISLRRDETRDLTVVFVSHLVLLVLTIVDATMHF